MTTILTRLLTLLPFTHRQGLADAQRQIEALSARCDLLLGCIRSQRETISGLSLQLCRRDGKAEHEAATIESLRLQLQACRRYGDRVTKELADATAERDEERKRAAELEAEAKDWFTRQVARMSVQNN